MSHIQIQYHKTSVGEFVLGAYEERLILLDFRYRRLRKTIDQKIQKSLQRSFMEEETPLLKETKQQLQEYLTKQRKVFELPLLFVGTEFQKQVWNALLKINYGTTTTYLELARKIGNEKATRAVANANGANSIALIVPCHRVLGSNKELTGYGGGLAIKKRLLKLEQEPSLFLQK